MDEQIPQETNYEPLHKKQESDTPVYGNTSDDLKAAAAEVTETRETKAPQESSDDDGVVTRTYRRLDDRSKIPDNKTVSLREASRDLAAMRNFEGAVQDQPKAERLTAAIDAMRQGYPDKELPADFVPQLKQYAEQAAEQQPQEQPAQPEPQPEVAAQPEQQATEQPGVDPEIVQALQNPKIRAALEQEVAQVEQARAAYQQGLHQAAQISAAALFSQFPELTNLRSDQLATAIEVIGKTDPQKAHAINAAVQRTQTLLNASRESEERARQLQQAQLQAFVAAEDVKWEEAIRKTDSSENIQRLKSEAPRIAERYYGISKDQLAVLWQSQPFMRTAAFQLAFADAIKFRLAQEGIKDPARLGNVPPVQRPGAAMARAENDSDVTRAMTRFREDPNPKNAAELLLARRAKAPRG